MKVKITHSFTYDGMFVHQKTLPKSKQREVEVVGVMSPVDPGWVTIQDGEEQRQVPTFAIDPSPKIDFGVMLTKEQKRIRKTGGILFGTGVAQKRKLIPLDKCPISANEKW